MAVFILTAVVFVITLLSCLSDIRSLRIPNAHSLAIVACFAVAFLLSPDSFGPLSHHLGALAVVFVTTYLMFIAGLMGGGDSKLGTALALWVGAKAVLVYVFWMTALGGVLGLVSLWIARKKPFKNPPLGGWVATLQEGKNAIPYGIAITFGAWIAMWHSGFIAQQMDEVFKIIH